MSSPRILISEPNGPDGPYLPYLWAILKSYWERHGSAPAAFSWLDPIYLRETPKDGLEAHCCGPVDVVGLSCYTWNWDLNCKVARWAKEQNPACLVVAGGPDPDYKDPEFFRKHSYIDIVIDKDGEIPFTKILETVLKGERDFKHIPGLYLPAPDGGEHHFTGRAEVPTVFDYSPYVDQTELYERIMASRENKWINAIFETTRGCPYSCNYCDWGSATMSKVRKFDLSRVYAEIDWFAKMGISFLMMADANFGMLPRDVEIAERLAETKAKYGYPKGLYYSAAKNNPERTIEIARRTYEAGLTKGHVLAVQHTDQEILKNADRSNIPAAKFREQVSKLEELGIPSEVQLILGIPGDTVEKWKNCLTEIMEWGVHENCHVYHYALLPNAPASDPAFLQKWQVETVDRGLIPLHGLKMKQGEIEYIKSKLVVGWQGFAPEDWVEASTYSAFVDAWHSRALTRLPAIYLWYAHGVAYREFYKAVIDEFARESELIAPINQQVRDLYRDFLQNPDATNAMEIEELPKSSFLVEPGRWIYTKTCLKLDAFYEDLSRFILRRFPMAKHLKSVIDYQKNLVVTAGYSRTMGKIFPLDRDWPTFFATARRQSEYQKLAEPTAFYMPRIAEVPEADWMDFGGGPMDDRWLRWLSLVFGGYSIEYSNYPPPRLHRFPLRWSARRAVRIARLCKRYAVSTARAPIHRLLTKAGR